MYEKIDYSPPPPLPDWLSAVPDNVTAPPPSPANQYILAEVNHLIYSDMFEIVLSKVAAGLSMARIMREAQRGPEQAEFIRWIMKDQKRKARYEEAMMYGAEVMKSQLVDIADGLDENGKEIMEDIQRSKLRIDTRLKVMGFDNKKRFGDTKQIEITQTISITDALREAQGRVSQIIDAEDITPKLDYDDGT